MQSNQAAELGYGYFGVRVLLDIICIYIYVIYSYMYASVF